MHLRCERSGESEADNRKEGEVCEKKGLKKFGVIVGIRFDLLRAHCLNAFEIVPGPGIKRKTTDAKKDVRHGGERARGRGEK